MGGVRGQERGFLGGRRTSEVHLLSPPPPTHPTHPPLPPTHPPGHASAPCPAAGASVPPPGGQAPPRAALPLCMGWVRRRGGGALKCVCVCVCVGGGRPLRFSAVGHPPTRLPTPTHPPPNTHTKRVRAQMGRRPRCCLCCCCCLPACPPAHPRPLEAARAGRPWRLPACRRRLCAQCRLGQARGCVGGGGRRYAFVCVR